MKTEKGRKSRRGKAGSFVIFLSLLLAALFIPQGIFTLQDALRYREHGLYRFGAEYYPIAGFL